jgi:membrane protein implicated in regulation of membrane protease activity
MLLQAYVVALVLGGGLVAVSALGFDKDPEATEVDHAIGDPHADHVAHGVDTSAALAFLGSLRFWSFASGAFGAIGILLTFAGVGPWVTGLAAVGGGFAIGVGAALAFRWFARGTVSSQLDTRSLAGRDAEVVLSVGPGKTGKVRVTHQGQTLELPATTHEPQLLERGARVLVVSVEGGSADVTRLPAAIDAR